MNVRCSKTDSGVHNIVEHLCNIGDFFFPVALHRLFRRNIHRFCSIRNKEGGNIARVDRGYRKRRHHAIFKGRCTNGREDLLVGFVIHGVIDMKETLTVMDYNKSLFALDVIEADPPRHIRVNNAIISIVKKRNLQCFCNCLFDECKFRFGRMTLHLRKQHRNERAPDSARNI